MNSGAAEDADLGRLLLDAQRAYSSAALAELRLRGHDALTLSHANLMAQLGVEGAQVGELAIRAGVTKQAAASLIGDLEAAGFVRRAIDPGDRRAMIVTPTDTGWAFRRDAADVARLIESRWAAGAGEDELRNLRRGLLNVIPHI